MRGTGVLLCVFVCVCVGLYLTALPGAPPTVRADADEGSRRVAASGVEHRDLRQEQKGQGQRDETRSKREQAKVKAREAVTPDTTPALKHKATNQR